MIQAIIGIGIGCLITALFLFPKLKRVTVDNQSILKENSQLQLTRTKYTEEISQMEKTIGELNLQREKLLAQIEQINFNLEKQKEQADKTNEIIYQQSFELMQEKLEKAADEESEKFQKAQQEAEDEYLLCLQEQAKDFQKALEENAERLAEARKTLEEFRAKADAAIEAAKREEEKALELDKYKILLSEQDLIEINRLREIAPYFRNARAIYKIIWESYYRQNTTDLINRIIGAGTHTGIYKLTNLKNQKAYIGQAVDLSTRWKDHIKAGLGIDTPSNILYKAMTADGVENFSFEVLEECERSELNNRETYWIDFYNTTTFGYNMTKGGAKKQ